MNDMIGRIKELKKEKDISTEKLAELTGISLSTLNKILSSIADSVKLNNAVAIAGALGVSLDYLVNGIPENNNNYTLYDDEIEMIEDYRSLDIFSRELVRSTIRIERSRAMQQEKQKEEPAPAAPSSRKQAKELCFDSMRLITEVEPPKRERRKIDMYDIRVSAGPGQYTGDLSPAPAATISIPVDSKTASADYAVKISGHSMEPKFHDGDILLVEKTDTVDIGELCIFTLDNESYFKVYGGDRLLSLNPEFGNIMLSNYESVILNGRVLGKLKKSTVRK